MLRKIKRINLSAISIIFPTISALLLALPLLIPLESPLLSLTVFFAFLFIFKSIDRNQKGLADILIQYSLMGLVYNLLIFYWLTHVSLIGYVFLAIFQTPFFIAFGYFYYRINKNQTNCGITNLIALAASWTLIECIKSWIFMGSSWGSIGYSQYMSIFYIQSADFFGIHFISFLIMLSNLCFYQIIFKNTKRKSTIIFFSLFTLTNLFYGNYRISEINEEASPQKQIRLSVVQGNIPQELKWEEDARDLILESYKRLSIKAAKSRPDIIIWPETALPGFPDEDELKEYLYRLTAVIKTPLLFGAPTYDKSDQRFYNSTIFYNAEGSQKDIYHKLQLVPFGEYIPFHGIARKIVQIFMPFEIIDYSPGERYTIFSIDNHQFATLICFEDTIESLVRKFTKLNPHFLINMTNDAWFGDTSEPYQHLAFSVFRAIESRMPVVRSANTGISAIINSDGHIAAYALGRSGKKTFVESVLTYDVKYHKKDSSCFLSGTLLFSPVLLAYLVLFIAFRRSKKVPAVN